MDDATPFLALVSLPPLHTGNEPLFATVAGDLKKQLGVQFGLVTFKMFTRRLKKGRWNVSDFVTIVLANAFASLQNRIRIYPLRIATEES